MTYYFNWICRAWNFHTGIEMKIIFFLYLHRRTRLKLFLLDFDYIIAYKLRLARKLSSNSPRDYASAFARRCKHWSKGAAHAHKSHSDRAMIPCKVNRYLVLQQYLLISRSTFALAHMIKNLKLLICYPLQRRWLGWL